MDNIFQYAFMQRAFVVAAIIAVIAPCIGVSIVLKRLSAIGDATSHSALAGIAFGEKFLPFVIVTSYRIMYHHMTNIELPYNMK